MDIVIKNRQWRKQQTLFNTSYTSTQISNSDSSNIDKIIKQLISLDQSQIHKSQQIKRKSQIPIPYPNPQALSNIQSFTIDFFKGKLYTSWIIILQTAPQSTWDKIKQMTQQLLQYDPLCIIPWARSLQKGKQFFRAAQKAYFKIFIDIKFAKELLQFIQKQAILYKIAQIHFYSSEFHRDASIQYDRFRKNQGISKKVKSLVYDTDYQLQQIRKYLRNCCRFQRIQGEIIKTVNRFKDLLPAYYKLSDQDSSQKTKYRTNLYYFIGLNEQKQIQSNLKQFQLLVQRVYGSIKQKSNKNNKLTTQQLENSKQLQNLNQYLKLQHKKFDKLKQQDCKKVLILYGRPTFYYEVLNKMLRVCKQFQQFKSISIPFRQTYKSIKYFYKKKLKQTKRKRQKLTVYRGAPIQDKNNLKVGQYIQFLGFLSTSKNKQKGIQFAQNSQAYKDSSLIQIQIPQMTVNQQMYKYDHGFVDFQEYQLNTIDYQKQILINALNIFRIKQIILEKDINKQRSYDIIILQYGAIFDLQKQKQSLITISDKKVLQNYKYCKNKYEKMSQKIGAIDFLISNSKFQEAQQKITQKLKYSKDLQEVFHCLQNLHDIGYTKDASQQARQLLKNLQNNKQVQKSLIIQHGSKVVQILKQDQDNVSAKDVLLKQVQYLQKSGQNQIQMQIPDLLQILFKSSQIGHIQYEQGKINDSQKRFKQILLQITNIEQKLNQLQKLNQSQKQKLNQQYKQKLNQSQKQKLNQSLKQNKSQKQNIILNKQRIYKLSIEILLQRLKITKDKDEDDKQKDLYETGRRNLQFYKNLISSQIYIKSLTQKQSQQSKIYIKQMQSRLLRYSSVKQDKQRSQIILKQIIKQKKQQNQYNEQVAELQRQFVTNKAQQIITNLTAPQNNYIKQDQVQNNKQGQNKLNNNKNKLNNNKKYNQKQMRNQIQQVQRTFQQCINIYTHCLNRNHHKVSQLRNKYGLFQYQTGNYIKSIQQSSLVIQAQGKRRSKIKAMAVHIISKDYYSTGQIFKAMRMADLTIDILTGAIIKNDNSRLKKQYQSELIMNQIYIKTQLLRTKLYNKQKNHDLALKSIQNIQIQLKQHRNQVQKVSLKAQMYQQKGNTLALQKRLKQAFKYFNQAILIRKLQIGTNIMGNAISLCTMAKFLISHQLYDQGWKHIKKASQIFALPPVDNPNNWMFYFIKAYYYEKKKMIQQEKQAIQTASKLIQRRYNQSHINCYLIKTRQIKVLQRSARKIQQYKQVRDKYGELLQLLNQDKSIDEFEWKNNAVQNEKYGLRVDIQQSLKRIQGVIRRKGINPYDQARKKGIMSGIGRKKQRQLIESKIANSLIKRISLNNHLENNNNFESSNNNNFESNNNLYSHTNNLYSNNNVYNNNNNQSSNERNNNINVDNDNNIIMNSSNTNILISQNQINPSLVVISIQ